MECGNFKAIYITMMIIVLFFFWVGAFIQTTLLSGNKRLRRERRKEQGLPIVESVNEHEKLYINLVFPINRIVYGYIKFAITWSEYPWRLAVGSTALVFSGLYFIKQICK